MSVNDLGTDSGNGVSSFPIFSPDGTKVVFNSLASDLVPIDTNGTNDVFLRDLTTGTTTLLSVNDLGTDSGNGPSFAAGFSADGTKLLFISEASDLVPTDTNGLFDVFVRDLTTGTTTLVSVNDLGTDSGNGLSANSLISADGTKVAFLSDANDLVPTDTNGEFDVFVRDLTAGTTTLVSVNELGTDSGNGRSFITEAFSADGTRVAFTSRATDLGPTDTNSLQDIYVRDLTAGTTTLVSVNDLGTDSGNNVSAFARFSADGTKVAFMSAASDLVPTDTNGRFDVFVRDLAAGTTTLVSVNDLGTDSGNGRSSGPIIGADGTRVAFRSAASDLVPNDRTGGFFGRDVFLRDLTAGTTTLVSVNELGTDSGNGASERPFLSADGTKVAFESHAVDLVPTADTNRTLDVFVRDLTTGTTTLLSINDLGTSSGNNASQVAVISADGTKVVFMSGASDLVPTDTNGTNDVFLVDLLVEPAELIANLIADVVDLNLAKGISNSFDAKLDAVVKALADVNANNDAAAINALGAFIAGVEAQRGKTLTDTQADALIVAAQEIIDLLMA